MTLPESLRRRTWWMLPSSTMLLVLLSTLVAYTFVDVYPQLRPIAHLVDIIAVLLVVRLIRAAHTVWSSGWIIAIPNLLLQIAFVFIASPALEIAMLIAQAAFHLWAVVALMSYVMRDRIVTRDELFAIAGIYVLMALFWASCYALVIHVDADAIVINQANNPDARTSWADLVYYSMTTLTSTGYGDITPVSPAARSIAMLQQVTGVLFVAIIIARLTALNRGGPTSGN